MNATLRCQFCTRPLDLGQQFAYLVEHETRDNPVMLAAIRRLPHRGGRPLRCCMRCQAGIETKVGVRTGNPGRRGPRALTVAAVAVGLGFVAAWLGGPSN